MKTPGRAWARWVLVAMNGLIALAVLATALQIQLGSPTGGGYRLMVVPLLLCSLAIAALAWRQAKRAGVVPQTILALAVLFISIPAGWWAFVPYGVFALSSCWWLGDFWSPDEDTHSPKRAARLLMLKGRTIEEVRAMLIARGLDAGELEALLYELAVEDEIRRSLSAER